MNIKKIAASALSSLLLLGLTTGTALAWTFGLTGSGQCQPDGSFKIVWRVNNSENEALNITASTPAVVPVGTQVGAGQTATFSQTVSGTAAGSFSLSISGNFPSDQTVREQHATVTLGEACHQPGGMGGGGGCPHEDKDRNGEHGDEHHDGHHDEDRNGEHGDQHHDRHHNHQDCDQEENEGGNTTPPPATGGMGGGSTQAPVTVAVATTPVVQGASTTQVQTVPAGGVGAGFGGGVQNLSAGALIGLVASVGSLGIGLRRFSKNYQA